MISYTLQEKIALLGIFFYTFAVAEKSPIPVRLNAETIARIDAVARKLGESRGGVIKLCIHAFLSRFEHSGMSMLPPDWDDLLRALDGRTHRYSKIIRQEGNGNVAVAGDVNFPSAADADAGGKPPKKPRKPGK